MPGIAYRDLKPENVLLTTDGWPVITDFGLVAFIDEDGERADSMVGTPEFMSPEVVAGGGHDTDCDWWSFGVYLCELLTLSTPFREADNEGSHQKTYANIVHGRCGLTHLSLRGKAASLGLDAARLHDCTSGLVTRVGTLKCIWRELTDVFRCTPLSS